MIPLLIETGLVPHLEHNTAVSSRADWLNPQHVDGVAHGAEHDQEIIADIKAGKMVILMDDEDRGERRGP